MMKILISLMLVLNGSPFANAAASDGASSPCPTGFTQSSVSVAGGTKTCCEFKKGPICPPSNEQFIYEFSQDCGTTSPNTATLKYCCIKKPRPVICKEPNQMVTMDQGLCSKLGGTWEGSTKKCCLGCGTLPPAGTWTVAPFTSAAECKSPLFYIPSTPNNMTKGICCRKNGS